MAASGPPGLSMVSILIDAYELSILVEAFRLAETGGCISEDFGVRRRCGGTGSWGGSKTRERGERRIHAMTCGRVFEVVHVDIRSAEKDTIVSRAGEPSNTLGVTESSDGCCKWDGVLGRIGKGAGGRTRKSQHGNQIRTRGSKRLNRVWCDCGIGSSGTGRAGSGIVASRNCGGCCGSKVSFRIQMHLQSLQRARLMFGWVGAMACVDRSFVCLGAVV
jgi:hypothetical protein